MTVASESLSLNGNGRSMADTIDGPERVAVGRVEELLSSMGMGKGPTADIVAMLRRYGAIGPGYLLSPRGAERVNAAWRGDDLTADELTADFGDNLDRLKAELSRPDLAADAVLASVLADLVPGNPSPESLVRKLAHIGEFDIVVTLGRKGSIWEMVVRRPEGMGREEAVSLARGAIGHVSEHPEAVVFEESRPDGPAFARDDSGDAGNLGDKADATGKVDHSRPIPTVADHAHYLARAADPEFKPGECVEFTHYEGGPPVRAMVLGMRDGRIIASGTESQPWNLNPKDARRVDPPCSHKAVVPGTGAEICPGCGERVAEDTDPDSLEARIKAAHGPLVFETSNNTGNVRAWVQRTGVSGLGSDRGYAIKALARNLGLDKPQPPPTVGRLRRVLLTVDEFRTLQHRDEAEVAAFRDRAGLPRGTIMLEPEFDPSGHCYVATVECKEWPEVMLGDPVPWHPRHGR